MWLYADITSLSDIPRYYGRISGDKNALITQQRNTTFKELDTNSNRIANILISENISHGSHVGFFGKNSIEYFEALFGASKAGCAMLPLNWRLSALEVQTVIEDAQSPIIFVDREYRNLLDEVLAKSDLKFKLIEFDSTSTEKTDYLQRLEQASDADPLIKNRPEDTALLLYTSGTTGVPKGVKISQAGINNMRLVDHFEPAYGWQDEDVMLLVMPNFHLMGSGLSLQGLYNGTPLIILPSLDLKAMLDCIEIYKPTICCLVPTAIQMLLEHPDIDNADLSSLRMVMYAGSPITAPVLKRAMDKFKCDFMQFYGATETWALTLLRPNQHDIDNESRLKSCGSPVPFVEMKVVNGDGEELPNNQIGEFICRTPAMFNGYLNKEELTDEVMNNNWYSTGDAGFRDDEGLFYVVDRTKDMIITGGENVYSTEVEQALSKHSSVSQVAVIGVPCDKWGEQVTAIVVLAKDTQSSEEDLITHCRSLIAGYKTPKKIIFKDALPMTPTGKILKTTLRKNV